MNLLINVSIASNIALIILFGVAFVLGIKENSDPKLRAKTGTYLAIALLVYLVCIISLSVIGIVTRDFLTASFLFFVIMLFVIGRFVTYKTLKIFSAIQLFSFLLSLYVLHLIG